MTGRLKILAKEIKRRVDSGEDVEVVLENYKLLTPEEKQEILDWLSD